MLTISYYERSYLNLLQNLVDSSDSFCDRDIINISCIRIEDEYRITMFNSPDSCKRQSGDSSIIELPSGNPQLSKKPTFQSWLFSELGFFILTAFPGRKSRQPYNARNSWFPVPCGIPDDNSG